MTNFLVCIFLVHATSLVYGSSCDISSNDVFHKVLSNAEKNSQHGEFVEQDKLLRFLLSDESQVSTDYLARLAQVYLGESVGEILSEVITRRGNKILPSLVLRRCKETILEHCQHRSKTPNCNQSLRCTTPKRVERLIALIKEKQVFRSDEKLLSTLSNKEKCEIAKLLR